MSEYAFPKPKDIKHEPVHTRTYPDGRIAHNLMTAEGRRRYYATLDMRYREQNHLCPICHRFIAREDLTLYQPKVNEMNDNNSAVHIQCSSIQRGLSDAL